jgi:cytochrome c
MKYYRLNQIAMAVLGALLLFFGTRALIHIIHEEQEPEETGVEVAGKEAAKGEEKPGGADLAALLASGDAAHGEQVAKKCAICHTFDKGGENLIGPNLYDVLGRKVASHEGYDYSDALKAKGGEWDYAMINHMIENPGAFVPGTKMALFPGLPDAKDRADVLLFLRTKNDNPPPLPEATAAPAKEAPAAEAPAAEAPAGGSEIVALLATADPAKGEADVAVCKVCHTFEKGGAVLVGPNLYGVVGRDIASQEGFNYTPGLKSKEGNWTFEHLDTWLTNPQAFAPGTTMAFPGVPDAKKRADIIAFLRSNSDNPVPLPAAGKEAPAAEPAAPAEPAAKPEAPAEEAPAAEPEAPAEPEAAAPEEAPAAKPEAPAEPEAAAPEEAPAAEAPAEPEAAAPEEAPAAEPEIQAEPEAAAPKEAPAAEPETPAAEEEYAPSEPSMGEPPSPSQPQPVYPDQESEDAPAAETPAAEAPSSAGESASPSQPQPVYPDGPPEGVE